MQTLWKSENVAAGTAAYDLAKVSAEFGARQARKQGHPAARVDWRDDYNDYSVRGVWAVVA